MVEHARMAAQMSSLDGWDAEERVAVAGGDVMVPALQIWLLGEFHLLYHGASLAAVNTARQCKVCPPVETKRSASGKA